MPFSLAAYIIDSIASCFSKRLYLFAVRSAVLAYDDLCGLGVGALDIDREFQNLIIVPHIQPSQGQGVQPQLQLRLPAAAQGVSGAASL
jgi:hypothetical protein